MGELLLRIPRLIRRARGSRLVLERILKCVDGVGALNQDFAARRLDSLTFLAIVVV